MIAEHQYISTSCQHGLHGRCRMQCKFCSAPCLCACHNHIAASLNDIKAILGELLKTGAVMTKELDDLQTQVEETTTVEQSAIELLNGLSQQIQDLKDDPAALTALSNSLRSKSSELAAAVAANTPAAPNA